MMGNRSSLLPTHRDGMKWTNPVRRERIAMSLLSNIDHWYLIYWLIDCLLNGVQTYTRYRTNLSNRPSGPSEPSAHTCTTDYGLSTLNKPIGADKPVGLLDWSSTDYGLRTADYGLRTTDHRLSIPVVRYRTYREYQPSQNETKVQKRVGRYEFTSQEN